MTTNTIIALGIFLIAAPFIVYEIREQYLMRHWTQFSVACLVLLAAAGISEPHERQDGTQFRTGANGTPGLIQAARQTKTPADKAGVRVFTLQFLTRLSGLVRPFPGDAE